MLVLGAWCFVVVLSTLCFVAVLGSWYRCSATETVVDGLNSIAFPGSRCFQREGFRKLIITTLLMFSNQYKKKLVNL